MKVIKRDGQIIDFNKEKISIAINKAFVETSGEKSISANIIANEIENLIKDKTEPTSVEKIQDYVEDSLIRHDFVLVAKNYIKYRYLHKMARDKYSELMDAVSEKLSASNVQNQNANIDEHSFGGRVGETSDLVTKKYALDYCVSARTRENHLNNEVYIHDLSAYAVGSHNCLSLPFDDLLKNGFNTRQTDVRPANSVATAFQLIAVIFQIQSLQQFGRLNTAC